MDGPEPTGLPNSTFVGFVDGNGGQAVSDQGMTVHTLIAAISYALGAFVVQILLFSWLRPQLTSVYQPRIHTAAEHRRFSEPPNTYFGWIPLLFTISDSAILQECGLDAYFFLRYLRTMQKIFIPLTLLILPTLLPVNRKSGASCEAQQASCTYGLDKLTISNIAPYNTKTILWAHFALAIVVVAWTCYTIYVELQRFVYIRQKFLISRSYRLQTTAKTVFIDNIPLSMLTDEKLSALYSIFPGGVRHVWINRNFDYLSTKIKLREKFVKHLEKAETNLIRSCWRRHGAGEKWAREGSTTNISSPTTTEMCTQWPTRSNNDREQAFGEGAPRNSVFNLPDLSFSSLGLSYARRWSVVYRQDHEGHNHTIGSSSTQSARTPSQRRVSGCVEEEKPSQWKFLLNQHDRQTMRIQNTNRKLALPLPCLCQKVDAIDHSRREIHRLNVEIERHQKDIERFSPTRSAFVEFNRQIAAHMACQTLCYHLPQQMVPRMTDIDPRDLIWNNVSVLWWERWLRLIVVLIICTSLLILYAVPVSFSSFLAKLDILAATYWWLSWLENPPTTAKSILQGIVPPLLVNTVLTLMPICFRQLLKQQGVTTGIIQELGVQQWYFIFLFLQVFLVVTLSGGLISFATALANSPGRVPMMLAHNIPRAGNYFFSYLAIQALQNSAAALLQVSRLVEFYLLDPFLDLTPRQIWNRRAGNCVQWGSFFPPFTTFAVIGLIYSVIMPLILPFMVVIYTLFWIVYRYNIVFVYWYRTDSGGQFFPRAMNQLMAGIYVLELCLIGFFAISQDEGGNATCLPQAILMAVLLLATTTYHYLLRVSFNPLISCLPINLDEDMPLASKASPIGRSTTTSSCPENSCKDRNTAISTYPKDMIRTTRMNFSWRAVRFLNTVRQKFASWLDVGSKRFEHAIDVVDEMHPSLDTGSEQLEGLDAEHYHMQLPFRHPAIDAKQPVVWIPHDDLGISQAEITDTHLGKCGCVQMSDEGAKLDRRAKIIVTRAPRSGSDDHRVEHTLTVSPESEVV